MKKGLTLEQRARRLFTSASYQKEDERFVDSVAGRKVPITWMHDKKDSLTGCTDLKTIRINTANGFVTSAATLGDAHKSVLGVLLHEVMHILHTAQGVMKALLSELADGSFLSKLPYSDEKAEMGEYIKKPGAVPVLQQVCKSFFNNMEDCFVDCCGASVGGDAAEGLLTQVARMTDSIPSVSKMQRDGMEDISILHNTVLAYALTGEYNNVDETENDIISAMEELMPIIDDAVIAPATQERANAVIWMLPVIWPFVKESIDKMDTSGQQSSNENQRENGQSSGNGQQGDGQQSSGSSQQSGGQQGNGSSQDAGDPTQSENKVREILDKLRGEMMQTSQEQTNGADSNSSGNESNASTGKAGIGSEKEKGMPNAAMSIDEFRSLVNAAEEAVGDGLVEKTYGPCDRIDINSIEAELKRLEDVKTHEAFLPKRLNAESAEIQRAGVDIHKRCHIDIEREADIHLSWVSAYERLAPTLLPISEQLAESVKEVLKRRNPGRSPEIPRYCGSSLTGWYYRRDKKYFCKKEIPKEPLSLAVSGLFDLSGSMHGYKTDVARSTAMVLHDFCQRLKIPCSITGHNTKGDVTLYAFADFDSIDGNDKYRIMSMSSMASNRDGAAVQYCCEQLLKRKEKLKLFFLFSDGRPADTGYGGQAAEKDLSEMKKKYSDKGIIFVAAAIDADQKVIQRIYGDAYLDVTNLATLPCTITEIVKGKLLTK